MPKPKEFLKEIKGRKKRAEPILDTAEDYQAAGVDFEEAAGKHRAGDPVKSLRFFERAINVYAEGLRKFPESFDLAYNKARVQYEVAMHPKLVEQLQSPLLDVLRAALASHEYALNLDENDADLLFNTSQVLTSIAEELANDGDALEAIRLLQSALELQARCYSVQEFRYAENLKQQQEARKIFEGTPTDHTSTREHLPISDAQTADSSAAEEREWASVVEPVTVSTLAETVVACLGTMTTLCTTIASSGLSSLIDALPALADENTNLIAKTRSLSFPAGSLELHEICLADTILKSALLDAAFVFEKVDVEGYKQELGRLWDKDMPHLDLKSSEAAMIAHANASISFNASLSMTDSDPSLRWDALATAMASLASASKLPSIATREKMQTHLLRGDASLLQYRLSLPPTSHKTAVSNAKVLLKNAMVFYRNAAQLATEQEVRERGLFRSGVAQTLGEMGRLTLGHLDRLVVDVKKAQEELQEMLSDGILMEAMDDMGKKVYV